MLRADPVRDRLARPVPGGPAVDGQRRDATTGSAATAIGQVDVTGDMLHIRYQSTISDAHGHGPLEAGQAKLVAADVFARYATSFAANGGDPDVDARASRTS